MKSHSHEFWVVAIGRGLQVLLAMAALRVLSTALPITEVGYYYLIYSFVSWFGLVLINPVGMFANRMTNQWKKNGSLSHAAIGLLFYLTVITVFSLGLLTALNYFFEFSAGHPAYTLVVAVALQILSTSFTQTLLSMLNLSSQRLPYMATSLMIQTLALALPLALIFWCEATAFNWLLGLAFANGLGALLILWQFLRAENFKLQALTLKSVPVRQILGFGIPVACATFLMWLQTQGYRIGVERWIGREALAQLSIGLGTALSLFAPVESFLQQYLVPHLYHAMDEDSEENKRKAWTQIGGAALQFYATVFICFVLVAPHFLKLLVAPAYQGLIFIFTMGLCIELFRVMTNLIYLATHSQWVPQASLLPYSFGLLTLTVGAVGLYFGSTTDLNSLAVVLALASLVSFVAMWLRVRRLVKIAWSWKLFFKTNWILIPLSAFSFLNFDSIAFSIIAVGTAGCCALFSLYRLQKQLVHT